MFDHVKELHAQEPPEIVLADKPYLAGSTNSKFPATLKYAKKDDMETLRLDTNALMLQSKFSDIHIQNIANEIKNILDERLIERGAVLFRNLFSHIPDSIAFSKLISGLGERMPYIAGMATRDEMENSPGVMNASDDPEECTLEPHLEMCYREEMPSK